MHQKASRMRAITAGLDFLPLWAVARVDLAIAFGLFARMVYYSSMSDTGPLWFAQRKGQDWRDEDVLAMIDWLVSNVPSREWERRMDRVRTNFEQGKQAWAAGQQAALFDPKDLIAWYVFQANAYAAERQDFFEPECFRIAPVFRRLGQVLQSLRQVKGIEERAARLMTDGRKQPDDNLFELLVAASYKRGGWNEVAFVPEVKGGPKTQDLMVTRPRSRWAVECKRVNRSGYEAEEKAFGDALAAPVHALCRASGRSLVIEVFFHEELCNVENSYLVERARAFIDDPRRGGWSDSVAEGRVRDIDWRLMQMVLSADDIFFGSSRMVELLVGEYVPFADHNVAADWTPAEERPLHATAISQASVVSWLSGSSQAAFRKGRHFRAIVGRATEQLPGDCPAVIHVGYEARDGNTVDGRRHQLNQQEMRDFDPGRSRLRWVYGNYLSPEHTTARDEASALSETTATYRIGRHRTNDPLPRHLLFDDQPGDPGCHWAK